MVRLLPTAAESLAAQQVGRDVGWTGRSAHVFETSGHDPNAAIAHRPALRRRSSNRSSLGFEDEYQALYCCLRAIYDRCLWGTDWTRAFAVVNYEQAVKPFLETGRLTDAERAMLMGGACAKAYGWSPNKG